MWCMLLFSNAVRLCVSGPRASINLFPRVQFGGGLLCDTNLVKHADAEQKVAVAPHPGA